MTRELQHLLEDVRLSMGYDVYSRLFDEIVEMENSIDSLSIERDAMVMKYQDITSHSEFIIDTLETAIDWAEYADDYFKKKHGLEKDQENVKKCIEILRG